LRARILFFVDANDEKRLDIMVVSQADVAACQHAVALWAISVVPGRSFI
jgi:hypothetical protein